MILLILSILLLWNGVALMLRHEPDETDTADTPDTVLEQPGFLKILGGFLTVVGAFTLMTALSLLLT